MTANANVILQLPPGVDAIRFERQTLPSLTYSPDLDKYEPRPHESEEIPGRILAWGKAREESAVSVVRGYNSDEGAVFVSALEKSQTTVEDHAVPRWKCPLNKQGTEPGQAFVVLRDLTDKWPVQTDVCCWWDCHTFSGTPIGLPVRYDAKTDRFEGYGCFCSLECAAAYAQDSAQFRKQMERVGPLIAAFRHRLLGKQEVKVQQGALSESQVPQHIKGLKETMEVAFGKCAQCLEMVRTMEAHEHCPPKVTAVTASVQKTSWLRPYPRANPLPAAEKVWSAPPRCTLKMFGGLLDIDQFRNASGCKIYKVVNMPILPSCIHVEVFDVSTRRAKTVEEFRKAGGGGRGRKGKDKDPDVGGIVDKMKRLNIVR